MQARFRLDEWQATQKRALARWRVEVLGEPPTRKKVRKNLNNPFVITLLEWVATGVLGVMLMFTFGKVGMAAIPYALDLANALAHGQSISPLITGSFQAVTVVLFGLLATPGLIYFQLFDRDDKEVRALKDETARKAARYRKILWINPFWFTLEYLTPRLPVMLVYGITAWLFSISSNGNGTLFEKYLPVIAEVAFAHLVGTIISKRTSYSKLVTMRLDEDMAAYRERENSYLTDKAYLRILYQQMRADLANLTRNVSGKPVHVNRTWVETEASGTELDSAIMTEYLRLSGGTSFADRALELQKTQSVQLATAPITTTAAAAPTASGKIRLPPDGAQYWTPETLYSDLKIQGKTPADQINEAWIAQVYGGEHQARKAWRGENGARQRFYSN